MNIKLNRSYTKSFRKELLIILIQNSQTPQLDFNFVTLHKHIKFFRMLPENQAPLCLLLIEKTLILDKADNINIMLMCQFISHILQNKISYKKFRLKHNNSLQSNALFFQNRLHGYSSVVKNKKCVYIHPEIIIRKVRKYNYDTSIFQTFRELLYEIHTFSLKSIENFYYLCLNQIYREYDSFFIENCKRLNFELNDQKWLEIIAIAKWETSVLKYLPLKKIGISKNFKRIFINTIHYVRSRYFFILFLDSNYQAATDSYQRILRFFERRLSSHQLTLEYQLYQHKMMDFDQWLMQNKSNLYDASMSRSNNFSWDYKIILVSTAIVLPISFILAKLTRYRICTENGYPLTQLHWITWNDIQIVQYFLSFYDYYNWLYNGAFDSILSLRYAHYLIHYSCAKTLAFKHKTSLKFIINNNFAWRQMGKLNKVSSRIQETNCFWHLNSMNIKWR